VSDINKSTKTVSRLAWTKATDSFTPKPLDIETLNQLATRLRDHADGIRNPAAKAKLGADLHTAADVASAMAHWRFELAELAATLPAGNQARNKILKVLGKPDLAAADHADDDADKLADLRLGFPQVTEMHGLAAVPRWLCMKLGMMEIVKTTPTPEGDEVTATFPAWLPKRRRRSSSVAALDNGEAKGQPKGWPF
jgi:hypothetical protein